MKEVKSISCFSVVPTYHNERGEATSREKKRLIAQVECREVVEYFAILQKYVMVHKAAWQIYRNKKKNKKAIEDDTSGGDAEG